MVMPAIPAPITHVDVDVFVQTRTVGYEKCHSRTTRPSQWNQVWRPLDDSFRLPRAGVRVAATATVRDNLLAFCFVGDGAMQMTGLNELITIAKYQIWRDPRFLNLAMNNRDRNMVTWEQRILQGDRKFQASEGSARFSVCRLCSVARLGGNPHRPSAAHFNRSMVPVAR